MSFLDTGEIIKFNELLEIKSQPQHDSDKENIAAVNQDIYIFVIDVSASSKQKISKPDWFNGVCEYLRDNDYLVDLVNNDNKKFEAYTAGKIRLYKMLADMEYISNSQFAVWTVGNIGKPIFPNTDSRPKLEGNVLEGENLAPINKNNIKLAINDIEKVTMFDQHTDFIKLFNQILKEYKSIINNKKNNQINNNEQSPHKNHKKPSIIIIFMSDLLHDPEKRAKKIQDEWKKLEKEIINLYNLSIQANIFILTKEGIYKYKEDALQIFPVFQKYFDWYRLNKESIHSKLQNSLVYPNEFLSNTIDFYYENNAVIYNERSLLFTEKKVI